jgi:hypothetical protein
MLHERICSTNKWRNGSERQDCVFVEHDPDTPGFHGMHVVRVFALIKFKYKKTTYPCAVIKWFSATNNMPCPDTGMWIVERDQDDEYDNSS